MSKAFNFEERPFEAYSEFDDELNLFDLKAEDKMKGYPYGTFSQIS